jgi:hypothetical protein
MTRTVTLDWAEAEIANRQDTAVTIANHEREILLKLIYFSHREDTRKD